MEGFNTFDLIIIAIVLLLGLKGIINGFIKELFGVIGVVGGIFVASRYSIEVGEFINQNILKFENESAISITGFIVGFGLFWFITILVGKMFQSLTNASGLGGVNRLFGFVIGSGKIFLIFSIIAYAMANVELIKKNASFLEESKIYPTLFETGSYIVKFDISTIQTQAKEITEKVREPKEEDVIEREPKEQIKETPVTLEESLNQVTDSIDDTINEIKDEIEENISKTIESNLTKDEKI